MVGRGILIDVVKCVGCAECVLACQKANGQREHPARRLDEQTFTFLMEPRQGVHVRRLCMHCHRPTCVSVCPVAALRKTPEGPVTYEADRCMGCRYCLMACPFAVPTYEWRARAPRVRKCEMCAGRGDKGPACAEACPAEATLAGPRDALVAEARRRIAAEPGAYHPQIYGLREVGGTSVLYVGPHSPAELGLPTRLRSEALPELTWRVLQHVPDVVLFGSVLLGGIYWITSRRAEVRRAEGRRHGDGAEGQRHGDGAEGQRHGDGAEGQRYGDGNEGHDTRRPDGQGAGDDER